MNKEIKPLYRKVNTKARNYRSNNFGGDFKYSRHKKQDTLEQTKGTMFANNKRGLDYTPLFKFLLTKIGCEWDKVYSLVKPRLDKTEPIFWMVSLNADNKKDYIRIGESTFYSGLFVDENGILQISNPSFNPSSINDKHNYNFETNSFNGKRI